MSCITFDMEHEVSFDVIAEQVVADCLEGDLLCELARQNEAFVGQSKDGTEKAFALEFAKRLRELAKWFEDNAP